MMLELGAGDGLNLLGKVAMRMESYVAPISTEFMTRIFQSSSKWSLSILEAFVPPLTPHLCKLSTSNLNAATTDSQIFHPFIRFHPLSYASTLPHINH